MMKLSELMDGVEIRRRYIGEQVDDLIRILVSDITDNSDECTEGCVFVCIQGMRSDGHRYARRAMERGASVLVCEDGYFGDIRRIAEEFPLVCVISTENTRSAFAKMCASFYRLKEFGMRLVCVTGTNGKTTVATMICRALCACGKRAALLGTLGGFFEGTAYSCGTMTTPDPKRLCRILYDFATAGADTVVMEASSHALALGKLDGLDIYMGVFTNLTPEHLDFHKTMDEYAEAKSRLFSKCAVGGVFFSDDPYCERLIKALPEGRRSVRCSLVDRGADYFADEVCMLGENGVGYTVIHGNCRVNGLNDTGIRTNISCRIPGMFSVYNSLLAFAVLCELGVPSVCAAGAILSGGGVKGRMEKLKLPDGIGFSVYIDFAHTPDALSKLLRTVRDIACPGQRIVAMFGCGGDRDASKRSLMGAISSRLADLTVLTSDNCRSEEPLSIIDQILEGFDRSKPYIVIPDRKEAIEHVLKNALPGDIILLCGKGHEEYEIKGDTVREFSERKIVFDFLRADMER